MSYINKRISSGKILYQIGRIYKNQSSEFYNHIYELMGDAIQGIGYHINFEEKITPDDDPVIVKNNRASIPSDVQNIQSIEYYDLNNNLRRLPLDNGNRLRGLNLETNKKYSNTTSTEFYYIEGNYIKTSFTEGKLRLHYIGFAVDNEGLPYILDEFNYIEAVKYYIIYQLALEGYKHPVLNYSEAFQLWETYFPRAQNAAVMPSIEGMENFKNSFLAFITGTSNINQYYNG